eukprot:6196988-Pleurochrysis_carterae.AAC.1
MAFSPWLCGTTSRRVLQPLVGVSLKRELEQLLRLDTHGYMSLPNTVLGSSQKAFFHPFLTQKQSATLQRCVIHSTELPMRIYNYIYSVTDCLHEK